MTSRRSRAVLPVAAAAAALLLSGCAAGFDAQTNQPYTPGDGVIADVGDLKLRNVILVADEEGENASLIAAIVNDGEERDELLEISSDEGQVLAPELPLDLPVDTLVEIGPDDDETLVIVRGIAVEAGGYAPVTFRFANAGTVTLEVLTVLPTGAYEDSAPPALLR